MASNMAKHMVRSERHIPRGIRGISHARGTFPEIGRSERYAFERGTGNISGDGEYSMLSERMDSLEK